MQQILTLGLQDVKVINFSVASLHLYGTDEDFQV